MDRMYIFRKHDQWRGKPIYVEDEVDKNGYEICLADVDMKRGNINAITIEFEDENKGTYADSCRIVDYNRRIINFNIPLAILSNKGTYAFVITVSFNEDGERLFRSAKQTFKILETIEVSDDIQKSEHYPVLLELINEISQYKIDTSNFPTFEDLHDIIDSSLEGVSIEAILVVLKEKGYITQKELDNILRNYISRSELSSYAKVNDLNSYVAKKDIQSDYLYRYALISSLNDYVKKQNGKDLSTHDLTDELYERLVKIDPDTLLDKELMDKIKDSVTLEDVYSKEEVEHMFDTFLSTEPKILSFVADKPITNKIGDIIGHISFNWEYQGKPKVIRILGLFEEPLDVTSYSQCICYYSGEISTNRKVTLEITYANDLVLTKDIYFTFSYPAYYGVGYDSDLNIESYAQMQYTNGGDKVVELKFTSKNNQLFFAIPSSRGYVYNIEDINGMVCTSSFSTLNDTINNIPYNIYVLNYNVTCNDYSLMFFIGGDE